jgi:hypothetical protein
MRVAYHLDGCIDIRLHRRDLEAASVEALRNLQLAIDQFAESVGNGDRWGDEDWRPDPTDPPDVVERQHARHASRARP